MFQMAADTIFAVRVFHLHLEVIAVLAVQSFGNFLVAIEALEGGGAGAKLMAGVALCGAAEGFVGLGKRAGRDLCGSGASSKSGEDNDKGATKSERRVKYRPSELHILLARRPLVRSALAQELLRLEKSFFAAAERLSSLSYLAFTTNSREAVCRESCTGVQCGERLRVSPKVCSGSARRRPTLSQRLPWN